MNGSFLRRALFAFFALTCVAASQLSFSFIEIMPGARDLKIEKEVYEEYQTKLNNEPHFVSQENHKRTTIASQNIYNEMKNKTIETFTEYRELNPINLIHECRSCRGIERKKDNKKREEFERLIVDEMEKKQAAKKDAVNYVSFASGGFFPDLMILNQAYKQGIRSINVHFIDISYAAYIAAMEHVHGRRIEAFSACPLAAQLAGTQNPILKAYLAKYDDTASLALRHEMVSQCAHWVNHQYPQMECRIFLYGNTQDYIQAMKQNPGMTADIIAATDLGDTQLEFDAAQNVLISLVQTVSWYNPKLTTLFMTTQGVISRNPDWIANTIAQTVELVSTKKGKALVCGALLFACYHVIKKIRNMVV